MRTPQGHAWKFKNWALCPTVFCSTREHDGFGCRWIDPRDMTATSDRKLVLVNSGVVHLNFVINEVPELLVCQRVGLAKRGYWTSLPKLVRLVWRRETV